MNENSQTAFCIVCLLVGGIVPWTLLVVGGLISAFSDSGYWNETAAWLMATALFLLCISYLLTYSVNMLAEKRKL